MVAAGVRRRLLSSTYECGGRACREHLSEVPLAVYNENPKTEEVAKLVATLQRVADSCSFFVMDAQSVELRVSEWRGSLPFVRPFYSLRCNPDPFLLQLLTRDNHCNLHVSNLVELERAMSHVPNSRIVFHSPLLTRKTLRFLSNLQEPLAYIVMDDEESIMDAAQLNPAQPLLLRVTLSPDSDEVDLSMGTRVEDALDVVPRLLSQGIHLAGLSLQLLPSPGDEVVERAHHLLQMLRALSSCGLRVLDVGGGFRSGTIDQSSLLLEYILANSEQPNLKLIASPGRFFASSAFSLVTCITGKKEMDAGAITRNDADCGGRGFVYETNESFYGAFAGMQMGERMECHPLKLKGGEEEERHASAILGCARDSFDIPQRLGHLPSMSIGDCLLWKDMGAYSSRDDEVPVYYFMGRAHWERVRGGERREGEREDEGGLLSDGGSDTDTDTDIDDDDMAECFGRFFTH